MNLDIFLKYFVLFFVAPVMIVTSLLFSIKLKWPQFTLFFRGIRYMMPSREKENKMSSFAAVAAIIGGNLGTGTIVGTAVALSTGGPGAIAWMIATALLCSIVKLFCASLGVLFHEDQHNERKIGGPMFYMDKGLHFKLLAILYSIFLIGESITGGVFVQVNSFITSFGQDIDYKWALILSLAIPSAIILFGGLKRFAKFMSFIVPIMGLFFIAACFVGIFNLRDNLPGAIKQIMYGAIGINPIIGGGIGFAITSAISTGMSRILLAADIGLGLAGIAHANVDIHTDDIKEHARKQGIVALIAPIFVGILCAVTGILILCSSVDMSLNGSEICIAAFNKAFNTDHAQYFIQAIIYCFSLTTILAWAWFAEHAFFYMRKSALCKIFKIFVIAIMPVGAYMHGKLPWHLADICANGLIITNIVAIILLRKHVTELMFRDKEATI